MKLVESSTIYGFEQKENNDLVVEFKNGHTYLYENVPILLVKAFEDSDSKGKFLNQNIKNKFSYTRLK